MNNDVVCTVVEAFDVFVVWGVEISTDCRVAGNSVVVIIEDISGVESVVCCVFVVSIGEEGNVVGNSVDCCTVVVSISAEVCVDVVN